MNRRQGGPTPCGVRGVCPVRRRWISPGWRVLLPVLWLLLTWTAGAAAAETRQLTIAATGDLKGWIASGPFLPVRRWPHGLAHLAPVIADLRRDDPGLILLDAGDALTDGPSQAPDWPQRPAPAHGAMLRLMNHLRYDAAVLGNQDLRLPAAALQSLTSGSGFPWLAGNVRGTPGSARAGLSWPAVAWLQRGGLRIAVLGLTTPAVAAAAAPGRAPWTVEGLPATVRRTVPRLRAEGADLVVALLHAGLDGSYDREEAARAGLPLFSAAGELADDPASGLDLLISASALRREPLRTEAGDAARAVPVLQPGRQGEVLAVARLTLTRQAGRWRVTRVLRETLPADPRPDAAALALVAPELEAAAAWLSEPTPWYVRGSPSRRAFEGCAAALTHLAALDAAPPDAQKGAGLSLLPARWRNPRPGRTDRGQVLTRGHLHRWMPYAQPLVQVLLSGRQVELLLEGQVRAQRRWVTPPALVLAPGGLRFELPEKGARITALLRTDGTPLRPGDTAPVWITRWIWEGGGGRGPAAFLRQDQLLGEGAPSLREAVFGLLRRVRQVPPPCGRWMARKRPAAGRVGNAGGKAAVPAP